MIPRVKHRIGRTRSGIERRLERLPRRTDRPTPCPPVVQSFRAYGPRGRAPDVFFFGDSQSRSVAWTDWSKKPLGRMVAERLRPVPMYEVGHIAWHTEVFRALAHALAAMPKHPRCMVFAIHLREFSAQWVENPNFKFTEVIEAMEAYAADPGAPLRVVPPFPRLMRFALESPNRAAWRRYLETPVEYPGSDRKTIGEFIALELEHPTDEAEIRKRLEEIFTFQYLFELRPDDKRIEAARDVFITGKELDCQVVCYLSPVNWDAGSELLGTRFQESITHKAEMVRRALEPFEVHDFTSLLRSDCFFSPMSPLEHFNEKGRAILADEVAAAVKAALRRAGG